MIRTTGRNGGTNRRSSSDRGNDRRGRLVICGDGDIRGTRLGKNSECGQNLSLSASQAAEWADQGRASREDGYEDCLCGLGRTSGLDMATEDAVSLGISPIQSDTDRSLPRTCKRSMRPRCSMLNMRREIGEGEELTRKVESELPTVRSGPRGHPTWHKSASCLSRRKDSMMWCSEMSVPPDQMNKNDKVPQDVMCRGGIELL